MKITITRAGGYDPSKGPRHPDNQDPTLEPHATSIDTEPHSAGGQRHRWRCSCGSVGDWKLKPGSASIGGAKHVSRTAPRRTAP